MAQSQKHEGDVTELPGSIKRVTGISGRPVKHVGPATGDSLAWNGKQWAPGGLRVYSVASFGTKGDGHTDDTLAIQAAATAAGVTPQSSILYFPPGQYKITSPILVAAAGSVLGSGLSSRLLPNGCDGLHLKGPWTSIGPYFIRDLYIAGTSTTNNAAIRVDGALVNGDSVSGYEISNVRIDGFGYGMYLRNLWRSSIYQVRMVNVYYGCYLKGQNLVLNFDGVVCDRGTPPGTPTGATNSTGFFMDSAFDYNPGGNTEKRSESIRVKNSQFINFDIGIDHQRCLIATYDGVDLDFNGVYGIRYNQTDGGLRFRGDWIAMNGASALAGIIGVAVPAGQSKSLVEIDGFNITNYTANAANGIQIQDAQNNVAIRSCYIGPAGGGQDFQNADILIGGGGGNGNTQISIDDTICASVTPTNSLVVGTLGPVTGQARNSTFAKAPNLGSGASLKFYIDPGLEIGYDQITASVNIAATAPPGTTIIGGTARTYDGGPVVLEFFSPQITTPNAAAGNTVNIALFDGASQVVILGIIQTPAAANTKVPVLLRWRFTPSAGSHTYAIAAWAASTTGTPSVAAGTGGISSGFDPAYLRITRA